MRPIRPNPLMPTRTLIRLPFLAVGKRAPIYQDGPVRPATIRGMDAIRAAAAALALAAALRLRLGRRRREARAGAVRRPLAGPSSAWSTATPWSPGSTGDRVRVRLLGVDAPESAAGTARPSARASRRPTRPRPLPRGAAIALATDPTQGARTASAACWPRSPSRDEPRTVNEALVRQGSAGGLPRRRPRPPAAGAPRGGAGGARRGPGPLGVLPPLAGGQPGRQRRPRRHRRPPGTRGGCAGRPAVANARCPERGARSIAPRPIQRTDAGGAQVARLPVPRRGGTLGAVRPRRGVIGSGRERPPSGHLRPERDRGARGPPATSVQVVRRGLGRLGSRLRLGRDRRRDLGADDAEDAAADERDPGVEPDPLPRRREQAADQRRYPRWPGRPGRRRCCRCRRRSGRSRRGPSRSTRGRRPRSTGTYRRRSTSHPR